MHSGQPPPVIHPVALRVGILQLHGSLYIIVVVVVLLHVLVGRCDIGATVSG
jgi:hypothetical protein